MDRIVPYDKTGYGWKIARQLAKLPINSVPESLIFTSRFQSKVSNIDEVTLLKRKLLEAENREVQLWELYNELLSQYDELREIVFRTTKRNAF